MPASLHSLIKVLMLFLDKRRYLQEKLGRGDKEPWELTFTKKGLALGL